MEFGLPGSGASVPEQTWLAWISLGEHRHILTAADTNRICYAAIDWTREPSALDTEAAVKQVATSGIVIVKVFEYVKQQLPAHKIGWLATPLVLFDLEGVIRLAFASAPRGAIDALPMDVLDRWPWCDEHGLVFVVGRALERLVAPTQNATPFGRIVQRCTEREPAHRFASLAAVSTALHAIGGGPCLR